MSARRVPFATWARTPQKFLFLHDDKYDNTTTNAGASVEARALVLNGALTAVPYADAAHALLALATQGSRWYLVCRLLQAQQAKEQALRQLLLSVSHELREPAQSGLAASTLLAQRASVSSDAEASFLVQAVTASYGLLLGAFRARDALLQAHELTNVL